jgi:acetyl-CoA carboxylase alpha subunit
MENETIEVVTTEEIENTINEADFALLKEKMEELKSDLLKRDEQIFKMNEQLQKFVESRHKNEDVLTDYEKSIKLLKEMGQN